MEFPRPAANAFALGDAQHLYAGYGREMPPDQQVPSELLVSSDGGGTWETINMGLETDEIAVSPAFADDHTLLVALGAYHYNGGIVKSTDAGLTWHAADTGIDLVGEGISALSFSPAYAVDRTVFCVNDAIGVEVIYKSTDGSENWLPLNNPKLYPSGRPKLLISPHFAVDRTLWYVSYYVAAISRDGGQTWNRISQPLHLQAATEHCLPSGHCGVELLGVALEKAEQMEDDKYYAYRSFDYGRTWQCLEDPAAPPVAPLPPTEIPEPASWLLMIGGLAGLAYMVERRQTRQERNGHISA